MEYDYNEELQKLTFQSGGGALRYSPDFAQIRALDLFCNADRLPHNLGEMFQQLTSLRMCCWHDKSNLWPMTQSVPFPKVTHLSIRGDRFMFVLSAPSFPKLKRLEILDVDNSSTFNLATAHVDVVEVTPIGSMCLRGADAHVGRATVVRMQNGVPIGWPTTGCRVPVDWPKTMWLGGIRVDEMEVQPRYNVSMLRILQAKQVSTLRLSITEENLQYLVVQIFQCLRHKTLAGLKLLSIDIERTKIAAGSNGAVTRGQVVLTADAMRMLPEEVDLIRSEAGTSYFPLAGYAEARECLLGTSTGPKEVVLNLSLPVEFTTGDTRRTFG